MTIVDGTGESLLLAEKEREKADQQPKRGLGG